jgi:hypothetical protein
VPWKLKLQFGLKVTQSSFVNWNAGGRNNLSGRGFISASANYTKDQWLWKNNIELALGRLKNIDSLGKKERFQKTDDRIDISTSIGYKH